MEMKFTTANFEEEVLKSEIPVLVDFYADWCGPCQMMAPVIGQLAGEYEGRVKIGKLNVDENPDIAVRYKVMSIPTMIIFRNGEVLVQRRKWRRRLGGRCKSCVFGVRRGAV